MKNSWPVCRTALFMYLRKNWSNMKKALLSSFPLFFSALLNDGYMVKMLLFNSSFNYSCTAKPFSLYVCNAVSSPAVFPKNNVGLWDRQACGYLQVFKECSWAPKKLWFFRKLVKRIFHPLDVFNFWNEESVAIKYKWLEPLELGF